MRDFGESPILLFITTVVSHLTMLPTICIFYRRGYVFELCVAIFALTASFMYHTCESFNIEVLLSELQWHRLDNIGIISIMGIWSVFISCFQNPLVERGCKYTTLLLAIAFQQRHPWDVRLTVAPILLFAMIPVVQHFMINRRLPAINRRHMVACLGSVCLAVPCFALGLNDAADPYRVFHGLWHFCAGIGSLYFMLMVVNPSTAGPFSAEAVTKELSPLV